MRQIVNVWLLTMLVFFMFGVCGMTLCGSVTHGPTGVTELNNFDDIISSMMLLFQLATGTSMTPTLDMCSEKIGWPMGDFLGGYIRRGYLLYSCSRIPNNTCILA